MTRGFQHHKADRSQQADLRTGKPARAGEMAAMIVAFLVPFLAGFNFIMNHFYVSGGYLQDSGWFAALMWHPQEFALGNPAVLDNELFYSTHLSPILYAIGLASFLFPWGQIIWFASFQGVILGGGGLVAFIALRRMPFMAAKPVWLALLAVIYALGGLSMAILSYPHIEALGTLMACACLAAFFSGRRGLAVLFLLLSVSVREDMGFHIVAPLGLLWLWTMWKARSLTAGKDILAILLLAFSLSVAAIMVRSALFPADNAFARIYTGTPTYAHLTLELMQERFANLFTHRLYLVLPALVALVAALLWRNPVPVIGFIAYLPWFLLNITAFSNAAGSLAIYYPFPFQIAIFWFLWWAWASPSPASNALTPGQRQGRVFVPLFLVSGLAVGLPFSTLVPAWNNIVNTLLPAWSSTVVTATDAAVRNIADNRDLFGRLKADPSLLALHPRGFLSEDNIENAMEAQPDTLIWHERNIRMMETREQLVHFPASALYNIAGTPFYLASHIPRERLEQTGLRLQPLMDRNILPLMRGRNGQIDSSVYDLSNAGSGEKLYGPGIILPPGRYRVDIRAWFFDHTAGDALADVYNTVSGRTTSTPLLRGEGESTTVTSMEFTVGAAQQGTWEFRIAGEKSRGIRVTGVYLHAITDGT